MQATEAIQLHLDPGTLSRARELASSRQQSLEELIADLIEQEAAAEQTSDPILGMFADEPELVDQIVDEAMAARQHHPLRSAGG